MSSFDDLYASTIYFLRMNGNLPTYSVRYRLNSHFLSKPDESVIALMVIVVKNPTPREIKQRKVMPLQEILNDLPTKLRSGMLSWLILPEETEPSSLVIHSGISMEGLTLFAHIRLIRLSFEKLRQRRFSWLNFGKIKQTRTTILEAQEQAKKSSLGYSEPVAHYLR